MQLRWRISALDTTKASVPKHCPHTHESLTLTWKMSQRCTLLLNSVVFACCTWPSFDTKPPPPRCFSLLPTFFLGPVTFVVRSCRARTRQGRTHSLKSQCTALRSWAHPTHICAFCLLLDVQPLEGRTCLCLFRPHGPLLMKSKKVSRSRLSHPGTDPAVVWEAEEIFKLICFLHYPLIDELIFRE